MPHYHFQMPNKFHDSGTSNKLQLYLVIATFLAVAVAMFGERLWRLWERPRVSVNFDETSERCLRYAESEVETLQVDGTIRNVERYYFRLNVINNGRSTAKNIRVRADILDENLKEVDQFEPSTLRWINNSSKVELARGESEYVNLLSQLTNHPTVNRRIHIDLSDLSLRAIAWDRPLAIFNIKIVVHGDNIKPFQVWFKFKPNKNISKPGKLVAVKS